MMNKATLSFTVALLVLGLLISMQFKAHQGIANLLEYQNPMDLVTIYRTMEAREAELLETLNDLHQRRSELISQATREEELTYQAQREIEQLKILNGEVPVSGPGITVTITRDAHLWHFDLVDLVNELWASNAEAIAINDHRVTVSTHLQQHTPIDEILLNNETLLFPIIVTAIGDPHALEMGLNLPGGLVDSWRTFHAIHPTITARDRVSIPAARAQETIHR